MRRKILLATILATAIIGSTQITASAVPTVPPSGDALVHWAQIPTSPGTYAEELTVTGDGVIWFALDGRITSYDPSTGTMTPYPRASVAVARSIAAAPDGRIWYSDLATDALRRLDPATGAVEDIVMPSGLHPRDVEIGGDGAVWFGTDNAGRIGRVGFSDAAAVVVDYGRPTGLPDDIAWGPDGRVWVLDNARGIVVAFNPSTGAAESFGISGTASGKIEAGIDGHLWVAAGSTVTRLSVRGSAKSFPLPDVDGHPYARDLESTARGIFVATNTEIVRIGFDESITTISYAQPGGSADSLVVSPDGYVWYSDGANRALMFG